MIMRLHTIVIPPNDIIIPPDDIVIRPDDTGIRPHGILIRSSLFTIVWQPNFLSCTKWAQNDLEAA